MCWRKCQQPLTPAYSLIHSLDGNALCGVSEYRFGTYTAEGITKIAEMLKVNRTLQSIRYLAAGKCSLLLSAAANTPYRSALDSRQFAPKQHR